MDFRQAMRAYALRSLHNHHFVFAPFGRLGGREMWLCPFCAFVILLTAISGVGCASLEQQNLSEGHPAASGSGYGVVVGSVTAPFARNHHETVQFEYRKMGDGDANEGVITSGMQHTNFLVGIPSCTEGGLAQQCGRLFAVRLPVGSYEVYKATVLTRGLFQQMLPAGFTVHEREVSYIGNISVTYCTGLVTRYRGNILGADVSIKDEYVRDVTLARDRFERLRDASIQKRLLPDNSWRWRVSWKSVFGESVEPHDWGDCQTSPGGAPRVAL